MDESNAGKDVRGSAESTVATIADQAQQTAEAHVSTQKDQAAGALHSVAEAVRRSGDQLRDEQPQLASLATQAAERVDKASDYIRQHDVRDFVRTAEDFARREPLIFLGGAFAIGFLASRFLKASSPSRGASGEGDWNSAGGRADYSGYGGQQSYGGQLRSSGGDLQAASYQSDRSLGLSDSVGTISSDSQVDDYATRGSYMADADSSAEADVDEQSVGGANARSGG